MPNKGGFCASFIISQTKLPPTLSARHLPSFHKKLQQFGLEERVNSKEHKWNIVLATTPESSDLSMMAHLANVQACSISTEDISMWNLLPKGRGNWKVNNQMLSLPLPPPTPPGSPRPVLLARRAVTALGNICFCHYQYLPGALPAPHRLARPGRSRELGAGAQDKSPNGEEAVSGVCREEEGRTESQAQQRLQLNQFGDKNSACRPCLCSDFIKVSAALESQQASTCVPASTPNTGDWRQGAKKQPQAGAALLQHSSIPLLLELCSQDPSPGVPFPSPAL